MSVYVSRFGVLTAMKLQVVVFSVEAAYVP
jgi:hypothetical protein